jgi:2-polyprenyl-3-methyl-5-hydroxy-6-metoxy-1,4-benzoquinol methylase
MPDYKNQLYERYRSIFNGNADLASLQFGASKLRPVIVRWVADLTREARVCDLGCGAGEFLLAFKELCFEKLSGCDLSAEPPEISYSPLGRVLIK